MAMDVPPPGDEPPPPPGKARLKTGSIPIESRLLINGDPISSFVLGKRALPPGRYTVRIERGDACVAFAVDLGNDETVYLIWDFGAGQWRWHERRNPRGRTTLLPAVTRCKQEP